ELNFSTQEIGMKFDIGSSIVSKTSKREEETGERKKRDKLECAYINQTKKFGGGSIMVWSCITSCSVGEICYIKTHLDNESYRVILAKDLFGTLLEHNLELKDIIFQYDGNSKHRWPPYSPDLSLIENIWSEVKRCLEERLEEQQQEPATKNEKLNKLWKMVEEE
ncbi:15138_t:CDS:2, partial [Dentiscutata erythropus]